MDIKRKKLDYIWVKRALILLVLDLLFIVGSYFAALWLRFDFSFNAIPPEYFEGLLEKLRKKV